MDQTVELSILDTFENKLMAYKKSEGEEMVEN